MPGGLHKGNTGTLYNAGASMRSETEAGTLL